MDINTIHPLRGQRLSRLETDIVRALADGHTSYQEIAIVLNRTLSSVRNGACRLQRKVGANDQVHLAFLIAGHMPAPSNLLRALQTEDSS